MRGRRSDEWARRRWMCAMALAIGPFVAGMSLWASGCGGRSAGHTTDAGSFDATTPASEAGPPTSADAIGPPLLDAAPPPVGDSIAPAVRCDPSACASGCCGAAGCLPGTTATACGFGGQACTDCTALGLDCVPPMAGETGGVCGSIDAGTTMDGAAPCGPSTCAGCCAGTVCVAGTTSASCGSHGLACQQCTAANVKCVPQGAAGACVGTGAHCSPSNCAGCCDSSGVCQVAAAISACGAGGTSCQFCLPGQACNSGQCQTTNGCGPANCVGCCQGGMCLSGSIDESACGSGGAQCQRCSSPPDCLPLGVKNGGACPAPSAPQPSPDEEPSSGSSSSSGSGTSECSGCVALPLGQCHPGNTNTYCIGPNRNQGCGTCGGSCATGVCTGGSFCNFSTCHGCCMPDGTCWTGGPDDAHCGGGPGPFASGALCINCGPGYICDTLNNTPFPVCLIACSPQNCKGCCVRGVCSTGTDPTSCGTAGNVCAQCAPGQSCLNGACVTLSQCGPTLCAGCCENSVCLVGFDNAACGTGGGLCENCSDAGHKCVGATCTQ